MGRNRVNSGTKEEEERETHSSPSSFGSDEKRRTGLLGSLGGGVQWRSSGRVGRALFTWKPSVAQAEEDGVSALGKTRAVDPPLMGWPRPRALKEDWLRVRIGEGGS